MQAKAASQGDAVSQTPSHRPGDQRVEFDWNDVSSLSPQLFGYAAEPKRSIASPDGSAYLYELEPPVAGGYVEFFRFTDGLSMVVFDCLWYESRRFEVRDDGRCRLSFTLDLNMTMDVGTEVIDATSPAWRLMNNAAGVVTQETVSAGSRTVWVTLAFHSDYLWKYLGDPNDPEVAAKLQLFQPNPAKSIVRSFPLDHQLNLVTGNILSLNVHDAVYVALARTKALELFSHALDRLLSDTYAGDSLPVRLRPRDRKAIRLAHDLLNGNLADPPSIRELCVAVGLNRNKLHYGFKEEFGLSPSQYLEERRLDTAYGRLTQTDDLIYQIAADVGYNSQSSFSTAFKRKFGITPKDARGNRA